MSIQFNDTTNYKGLVQIYEKEAGYNRGDVSGDTELLKEFAADANLALDDLFRIGIKASGKWQLDDSNHETYPIITHAIVSGQRDYQFTVDSEGNAILDIYAVYVRISATGQYQRIWSADPAIDPQDSPEEFTDGLDAQGIPWRYDKIANAVRTDVVPNYDSPDGIMMYVNREPSYFSYLDTTKKPGVSGRLHRYLALKPAMDRARRLSLPTYAALQLEVANLEKAITEEYAMRSKDTRTVLTARRIIYK